MKFFKRTVSPSQVFKKILFSHFYFVVAIASFTLLYFLISAFFVAIGYSMSEAGILQNLSEILEKVGYAVLPFIIGVLIIYLPAIPYDITIFFGDQAGYFLELAFNKKVPIWVRILASFLGTIILFLIFYIFFIIGSIAIDLYSKINELLDMNLLNFLKEAFNS